MERQLFTFANNENYSYDIDDELTLHIVTANIHVFYVYFSSKGENVHIPISISILSHEEKSGSILYENSLRKYIIEPEMMRPTNEFKILPSTGKNYYVLDAKNKYEIRYNNKTVINITPQPCCKITPDK
jgi:hypothetical protein